MKLLIGKEQQKYYVDASQYPYGRLCSHIAMFLLDKPNPNRCFEGPKSLVYVQNMANINMSDRKKEDKKIRSYSGFPGGLKERNPEYFISTNQIDVMIRKSVKRMLPKTRYFRRSLIERLIFTRE